MKTTKAAATRRGRVLPLVPPAPTAQVGEPAPLFDGTPLAGRASVRLNDYRGKVVCLQFWASWCVPCRQSLPWLERLHRQFGAAGFEAIGINVDETRAEALRFVKRFPVGFPVVGDAADTIAAQYDVRDLPSLCLIDRHGVLRTVHEGFRYGDSSRLRGAVADLLREP